MAEMLNLENYIETLSPLTESRADLLRKFLANGIPTTRNEDWKYTDLKKLNSLQLIPAGFDTNADSIKALIKKVIYCENYAVIANGNLLPELSNFGAVFDLSSRPAKTAEGLGQHGNTFKYLSAAVCNNEICLNFKANQVFEQPLQLIFVSAPGIGNLSAVKLLVNADKSSEASIIETFVSADSSDTKLNLPVCTYKVSENAALTVYKIVQEAQMQIHIANQEAELGTNSRFYSCTFNLSGALTRNNLSARLLGENGFASLMGLNILTDNEHADNSTLLEHAVPNCQSYELYKGVYAGKSKGVFDGTIIVAKDAQKTNAIQSNQAVLLSNTAQSCARPQLKIWADDVKCTHGATCGALDEDSLFYLRSRGIELQEAKALLTQAFAGEVLSAIKNTELKTKLLSLAEEKLFSIAKH